MSSESAPSFMEASRLFKIIPQLISILIEEKLICIM